MNTKTKLSPADKLRQHVRELAARPRDESGRLSLRSKEVAVLIRLRLAREFPGHKFRVTSDHNSVRVDWTDGPATSIVNPILQEYEFGGFDGSIDLAYDSTQWLLPDGSMQLASRSGTAGSRGCVPSAATDCPEPGAFIVKYGPRYVFGQREIQEAHRETVRLLCEHYDAPYDAARWWNTRDSRGGDLVREALLALSRTSIPVGHMVGGIRLVKGDWQIDTRPAPTAAACVS